MMRRSDREITDPVRIESLLRAAQILRVGFYDAGEIYLVPVNYGYEKTGEAYTFYFHGAKAGRKYELSKASPMVGFELEGTYELIEGQQACEYSARYESIIGTAQIHLVEDPKQKVRGLNAIMKQTTGNASWSYEDAMLERVAVFRLEVRTMSCKAH